jgi:hypothetical protein
VGLTALDLHQLNQYFLDVPFPVLLLLAAGLMAGRRALSSRDWVPMGGLLALIGLLFFYWHRDVFYGPRFLFSAVPWVAILLARATVLARSGRRRGVLARYVPLLLAVGIAVGGVMLTPERIRTYRDSTPALNLHPDRAARQAGLDHAVVVIPDGWGSRLIARMWAEGVPVRRSTRFYIAIDACTLEGVLDHAAADPRARAGLVETLDSLAALEQPGVPFNATADPLLRLPADGRISPDCAAEIEYDRTGFLLFAPFLYLNNAELDGPVVFARDMRDRNERLRRRYPDRSFFRFAPAAPGEDPVLTPLE